MIVIIYPQLSLGDSFKSSEVLEWPALKQSGYFTTSVTMAGVIASQIDREKARCIDAWYIKETQSGFHTILDAMRKHSSIHPQGIILWVIQNECGKIGG